MKKQSQVKFKKFSSFEEENAESLRYWLSFSPEERVALVDSMITELLKSQGVEVESPPRLQRVLKIIERK